MNGMRTTMAAFTLVALGAAAEAQEPKRTTVFDIVMTFNYDRLPPDPYPNIVNHVRMSVALSGRNDVSIDRRRRIGRFVDGGRGTTTLGGGVWRVVAPNTLQATVNFPASVRTITLRTTGGNACSIDVAERLKPGATAFRYRRMDGGGMGNFTQPRLVSSSCTVR